MSPCLGATPGWKFQTWMVVTNTTNKQSQTADM
jgi:hypothetical protein